MKKSPVDRREFIQAMAGSAGVMSALPLSASSFGPNEHFRYVASEQAADHAPSTSGKAKIRFAVIGINHYHIDSQIETMQRAGGEFVSFYAREPDLVAEFLKRHPQAKLARSEQEILEDGSIQIVLSAAIPEDRALLGIRVMKHGKDFMSDKPGATTLEQLAEVRRVQAETRRIYSINYEERFGNTATVKAGELVKAGAIGRVVQTIGLGPHRLNLKSRAPWFFERKRYGGILCDIGSHQGDQFLFFTGSTRAEVVVSQVGNVGHPQYPGLEDFGDVVLHGDGGSGYVRVDWFTPDGLSTWGDGRLTILGTDGYIEIRKNVDIAGRSGGSHLFLVDQKQTQYIDCANQILPYGDQLVSDILNRTETAMSQEHCFMATEIMLKAQRDARRLGSAS